MLRQIKPAEGGQLSQAGPLDGDGLLERSMPSSTDRAAASNSFGARRHSRSKVRFGTYSTSHEAFA